MTEAPAAAGAKKTGTGPGRGRGWWRLLVNVYKEIGDDHVGLISAGVAFYGLLAIFPGIVALMAIAGLVMEPTGIVSQLEGLSRFLPQIRALRDFGWDGVFVATDSCALAHSLGLEVLYTDMGAAP